jgi:hypothetical protein
VSRARSAIFAALAGALFFAHGAALRTLAPAPAAAPLDPEATPAALVLGGFRVIAANALWVRLVERKESGACEEVPPLAEAILALDPGFEPAWIVAAWTIAVDIPALLPAGARWPWIKQGYLLIAKGARKNPHSWRLALYEGLLVEQHVASDPVRAERFRADRDLDPEGVAPLELAYRRFRDAAAIAGHAVAVDWAVARAAIALGRIEEAEAALEHVRAAHREASPDQIQLLEERLRRPPR